MECYETFGARLESRLTLGGGRVRVEITIRNELNAFLREDFTGGGEGQDAEFGLAGIAKAGFGSLQGRVVVAGMANELPGAFGDAAGNRVEEVFVECSGDQDAERSVGSEEAFAIDGFAEFAGEATQDLNFGVAFPESGSGEKLAGFQGQARSEGIAHGADTASGGCSEQRPENGREQVRVLVGVDVRDDDSGRLNFANLCSGFGRDLVCVHATGDGASGEGRHAIAKVGRGGERWELAGGKNRVAVDEEHMAADAQTREGFSQVHGFGEGGAVGHQRGRGDDSAGVSLDDGPVYARSVAKVICVDDQAAHGASLAGRGRGTVQRLYDGAARGRRRKA